MNPLCDSSSIRMGQQSEAVMAAALSANRGRIMGGDLSQDMMGLYMDKLKDLLPQCGSYDTNVSKLELIQHVIDYIGDLQDVLTSDYESDSDSDTHPTTPVTSHYGQQRYYTPNCYQASYEENN